MKNALLALLVSLVSLELFSVAATQANLLLFNDYPEIYQPRFSGNKWRTMKDPWGSWHKANTTDRHQSTCFDVRYASNAIGARDTEFEHVKPGGQTRYVLIGDSFAEGFGVNCSKHSNCPTFSVSRSASSSLFGGNALPGAFRLFETGEVYR